jgi:hypothetical protein
VWELLVLNSGSYLDSEWILLLFYSKKQRVTCVTKSWWISWLCREPEFEQENVNDRVGFHHVMLVVGLWPLLMHLANHTASAMGPVNRDIQDRLYSRFAYICTEVSIEFRLNFVLRNFVSTSKWPDGYEISRNSSQNFAIFAQFNKISRNFVICLNLKMYLHEFHCFRYKTIFFFTKYLLTFDGL